MGDNPFAEPEDDRTVFRPMPGGQRAPVRPPVRDDAPPSRAMRGDDAPPSRGMRGEAVRQDDARDSSRPSRADAEPPPVARGADLQTLVGAFSNPLIAAAAPLLQLLARLGTAAPPSDQGDMRDRTAREMREFERRAREADITMDQVRPAHYALCASLDDVVLNTPWGAHGRWAQRSLAATFHSDSGAGEGFFDQIRLMRTEPERHRHVLELMYLCMALGFMGPFRKRPDGAERMEKIRAQTYELILQARGGALPPLSARWEGADAPYRPRRTKFPVWVAASIAIAAVAGGFVTLLDRLNVRSDALLETALAAPPAAMPRIDRPTWVKPPPPPPERPPSGPLERLRTGLAAELASHQVELPASPSATIVRVPMKGLFNGLSGTLEKPGAALLEKIGGLLKGVGGPIQVLAYSDNQAIRTVKFPSNFALTKARAEAAKDVLQRALGGGQVTAEGRAEADPIAPNNSADNRERNRRLDIVLPTE